MGNIEATSGSHSAGVARIPTVLSVTDAEISALADAIVRYHGWQQNLLELKEQRKFKRRKKRETKKKAAA